MIMANHDETAAELTARLRLNRLLAQPGIDPQWLEEGLNRVTELGRVIRGHRDGRLDARSTRQSLHALVSGYSETIPHTPSAQRVAMVQIASILQAAVEMASRGLGLSDE